MTKDTKNIHTGLNLPIFVIALKFSSSFIPIPNSFLSLFVYIQISNFRCLLFLVVISVICLSQSTYFLSLFE